MMEDINRRRFLSNTVIGTAATLLSRGLGAARVESRPNIILILADDLGYGDLGCYGQTKIETPKIDQLALDGLRCTQCYAGSTVCAPSRSVLMTGQHAGHTRVRGNFCFEGGFLGYKGSRKVRRMSLTDEDTTVGHVLQRAGYRTGLIGKWHLDAFNPKGGPLDRGFDEFHGWLVQTPGTAGPVYYPAQRYHNRELVDVAANQQGARGLHHSDMCAAETLSFLERNDNRPFFLFLSENLPHSPIEAPDIDLYRNLKWPEPCKAYAAMVTRLDRLVGTVMKALKDLKLDERTIVFFSSDNGPRSEPTPQLTQIAEFFDSNGPLRGYKRDLYEGGIRVPMIARWPGRVPADRTSDRPWSFTDFLATAVDLAGAELPENVDGVSVLPTLLGGEQSLDDRFLYWEFFERGFQQAVRWRQWKAVRLAPDQPLVLFDLSSDPGEERDLAASHPEVIDRIEEYLKNARTESPEWLLRLAPSGARSDQFLKR